MKGIDMKFRLGFLVLAAPVAPLAHADGFSYVGALDPENPNDVFVTSFTLAAPSAVTIQTWSFGGGTNAAGTMIAAGGLDPYVSLLSGAGDGATLPASSDDGMCPPGNSAVACADSPLTISSLCAGRGAEREAAQLLPPRWQRSDRPGDPAVSEERAMRSRVRRAP